jgi:hypothetical protein
LGRHQALIQRVTVMPAVPLHGPHAWGALLHISTISPRLLSCAKSPTTPNHHNDALCHLTRHAGHQAPVTCGGQRPQLHDSSPPAANSYPHNHVGGSSSHNRSIHAANQCACIQCKHGDARGRDALASSQGQCTEQHGRSLPTRWRSAHVDQ